LILAFYFGGNSPGSVGWDVGDDDSIMTDSVTETQTPAPQQPLEITTDPVPAQSAEPTPEVTQPTEPAETPIPVESPAVNEQPSMEVDPETGKDKYQTDPVPEGKPLPVEPQDVVLGSNAYTCTMSISCATILDNLSFCDPEKVELVPEDGWVLEPITVTFYEGESVFNVLQRVCKQQKIHMEYEDTPIYNSAYIEGIHNLYEFDVGELSGWMYKVNEWFPNYGCSRYQLKDGDVICWVYTCDLGNDVGGGYVVGGNSREG